MSALDEALETYLRGGPRTTAGYELGHAAIDELTALRAKCRWVSMSKKPKEKGDYIVFVPRFGLDFRYYDGGGWYDSKQKATHWMPLPEPPALKDVP